MAILRYDGDKERNINEDEVIDSFGELVRKSERAPSNQNLRGVISKLEDNIKGNEKYLIKMFLVDKTTGAMINSDNSPNISFRVDTINLIFDSITKSVRDAGLTAEQTDGIFFAAGKKCGKEFGRNFATYLERYKGALPPEEVIKEWCEFDSFVGWGKLSYDHAERAVKITNNFQTKPNERTDEYPLNCSFFRGYISGVLGFILHNPAQEVTCASQDKCPKNFGGRDCILKIN